MNIKTYKASNVTNRRFWYKPTNQQIATKYTDQRLTDQFNQIINFTAKPPTGTLKKRRP